MKAPAFLLCLFPTFALAAGDLYVAPRHSLTERLGTKNRPFATLQEARDAIRAAKKAGDTGAWTVHVRKGLYPVPETIMFGPEDSGTATAPVTYVGESAAETRFCGGMRITGWHETPDGKWVADIPASTNGTPAYFESLFVNGRRAHRARHPNTGFFNPLAVEQTVLTNANPRAEYGQACIRGRPGELAPLAGTPKRELRYAQVVVHHKWDTTRRMILDFDSADETLYTQGAPWKHWNKWQTNSLYYVENVRAALDAPGEWFYDGCNGKLFYLPLMGEKLDRAEIVAPLPGIQTLVLFKGSPETTNFVRHLTFEKLAFLYTDSPRRADQVGMGFIAPAILGDPNAPGPTQFEPMQAAARTEAAIMADGTHAVTFRDCEIAHTGEYGIWLRAGCVSNRIERCAVTDLGAGGIRIGDPSGQGITASSNRLTTVLTPFSSAFNVVDNCIITHGGRFHASATAVWVGHSHDNQITHNEISDHYYTGVSVGWVWGYRGSAAQRNTIAFNRISKIGQRMLGDMGGIYTLGTSFGTCISNNVVFDVDSFTYGGWGLYPDEGSEGIVFENNLVYDTKDGSFHQHYGRDNVLRNNMLCYSRECQVAVSRVEPHRSVTVERNIILWERAPNFSDTRYTRSTAANVEWKNNLWWRTDGPVDFKGMTFAEWQALGRDVHGLVADPLFRDPARRDFRLRRGSPAVQTGFRPFDFSKAGVFGTRAWRRRTQDSEAAL